VLRDNAGTPLEGVRIAAVSRGGTNEDSALGAAMAGLAQTDEQGRFTLEDIPPGRYSIAAGRLDLQTYYPGTQSLENATVLSVKPGETISGINFALDNTSFGRSAGSSGAVAITAIIPLRVRMENGGKIPISMDGKIIGARLESSSGVLTIPIDGLSFLVPGPVATDFRVSVQDLPSIYEVKSITYGSTVIPQGIFQLSAANFPTVAPAPARVVTTTPPTAISTESDLLARLLANAAPNVQVITYAGSPLKPAAMPPSILTITLGETPKPSLGGVRVSGKTGTRDKRIVYISGRAGIVFSDGTFEFRNVPPGRHLIASIGSGRPFAAVVVVGDKDFDGVELKETPLLPDNAREPKDPMAAGALAAGSVVPLARIKGTVIEEVSKTPITEGEVLIRSGDSSQRVPIDSMGRFETFALLPGTYDLRFQIFGHSSVGPTVVVDDKDMNLEVTPRRLY